MTIAAAPAGAASVSAAVVKRNLPIMAGPPSVHSAHAISEKQDSSHQLVALHRVAELIVAELQRRRRLPLVPSALFKRGGEDGLLIFGDREAEVGASSRVPLRRRPARFGRQDLDRWRGLRFARGSRRKRAPGRL